MNAGYDYSILSDCYMITHLKALKQNLNHGYFLLLHLDTGAIIIFLRLANAQSFQSSHLLFLKTIFSMQNVP